MNANNPVDQSDVPARPEFDAKLLLSVLEDWISRSEPGDDPVSENRHATVTAMIDQLSALDGDRPVLVQRPNPAACPQCHEIDQVEEHGWVFARYALDIADDGSIEYPTGAEPEWDMCKPYVDVPAGAVSLYCQRCNLDYAYTPPAEQEETTRG